MPGLGLQIDPASFHEWLAAPARAKERTCWDEICNTCPIAMFLNTQVGENLWRVSPDRAKLFAIPEAVKDHRGYPIATFNLPSWAQNFIRVFDIKRGEALEHNLSADLWAVARGVLLAQV